MLSVGIIGLPNVGKSTLFNALLKKQQALAANYPFATIEPNVGIVPVPDERLERLAVLVAKEEIMIPPEILKQVQDDGLGKMGVTEEARKYLPPIVPATVKFVDIAGLVKGASTGEGLGNQFLSHIREVDAIVEVVRNFSDENVIRSGSISPKDDVGVVNTELILADLQTVQNAKSKISAKGGLVGSKLSREAGSLRSNQKNQNTASVIERLLAGLNAGKLAKDVELTDEEKDTVKSLQLLTNKPFIYVLNSDEDKVAELSFSQDSSPSSRATPRSDPSVRTPKDGTRVDSGQARMTVEGSGGQVIFVSAKLEAELSELSEKEQAEYLRQLGIKESGLDKVVKKAYEILGLINFFTAGPKEVRAWTIKRGSKAPQASGVIHSDFERGFIAAEVIACEELLKAESFKRAKDLGQIRLEGKDYVVQDGDVVEFRFSV